MVKVGVSQGKPSCANVNNNNSISISMAGNSTTSTPTLPVQRQARVRSDSKSTDLANTSDFSAGESTSELLEIDTPPLVLISSRVKSPKALSGCVNTGVVVVRYTYESTTLAKLLQLVGAKMKGRYALSIAFLMHGNASCLKVCSQKVSPYFRHSTYHISTSFLNSVLGACRIVLIPRLQGNRV